jgi:glycosyltransferase involved in cell wall biosynthesis
VAITKAYDYPGLGRPILASSLPSIAGVLRDAQEALLFSPGNAGDCAKALRRLATEPGLAADLVDAAKALAGKLSWQRRAENYVNLLGKTEDYHVPRPCDTRVNHGR